MRPTFVFGLALLALPACLVDTARYEALRDALADADGDGVTPRDGDCDDADPAVFPGQPDGCDGVDRDCDRTVDEDADRA
ncbi:MAG: putative metal-binding motif-containing protein [Myxococcota bacterium]